MVPAINVVVKSELVDVAAVTRIAASSLCRRCCASDNITSGGNRYVTVTVEL